MWESLAEYYCVDWVALVLNAVAIYLLGKKRRSGWSLGVAANLVWIAFGVLAHSVATMVACSIFVALNIKGWLNWRSEEASNLAPQASGSEGAP